MPATSSWTPRYALALLEVADAGDERLRARPVGDGGEHDRVGGRDRRVGELAAEPRADVAPDVERLRRHRGDELVAQPRERRERLRQRREARVGGAVAIGGDVDVGERGGRDEPRGGVRRRAVAAAGADEAAGQGEHGDGRERREHERAAHPGGERREVHAARRRCLRSAKSMITGMPSSP